MTSIQHDSVREAARRLHRQIAVYCVFYCWKHDQQAVLLNKQYLYKIVGITRVEESRLSWFFDDVRECFPYSKGVQRNGIDYYVLSKSSFESLNESKRYCEFKLWETLDIKEMEFSLEPTERQRAIGYLQKEMPFLFCDSNQTAHILSFILSSIASGNSSIDQVIRE